ncbi:aldehyde dehydrogenase domain-containing protein [Ilyonectria destructans]|nr:aldehyde dehydrogenase domain-containing protein [Ilyonectria destructans]
MPETKLFINNEYVDAKSGKTFTVYNASDNSVITDKIHAAGAVDVDAAVNAAEAAFKKGPWAKFTPAQRAKCMNKFADLVEQHATELAEWESLSMGQPTALSVGVTTIIAQLYRYYASLAGKVPGEQLPADDGVYKIVSHHPIGVCAGVGPWNGSGGMFATKTAPALAAGNTFVYKTSEKSPIGILQLGKFFVEAGFPPGVMNILSGAGEPGGLLASHMKVRMISFTGSTATGKKVQELAAQSNLKKVALELGGKSPALVFEDADFEITMGALTNGFLLNSGQSCVSSSRVYIQESVAPKYFQALKERYEGAKSLVGLPLDKKTMIGPVADRQQAQRILSFIESGKKEAELLVGGYRIGEADSNFIAPTIFINPKDDAKVYREEIFGPVMTIKTFKTEDEALEWANDTEFGLAGYVYTQDIGRALRLSAALEAGIIGVNTTVDPWGDTPFGGFKQSGYGKESGHAGLLEYFQAKTIQIR